jgi:hypothetical protein
MEVLKHQTEKIELLGVYKEWKLEDIVSVKSEGVKENI